MCKSMMEEMQVEQATLEKFDKLLGTVTFNE